MFQSHGVSFDLPAGASGANIYKRPGLQYAGSVSGKAKEDLQARAAKNYPDSPYLQAEWVRAVGVVRATKAGWVMDVTPLPPVPDRYRQ